MKTDFTKLSRRDFLGTAAAAACTVLPRRVLGRAGTVPPSGKLNIAGIGIGGKGASDLREAGTENIVAVCDVDLDYAALAIQRYPKAKVYTDFRVMLEKQKDIDAVMIATPDHTHAVIALAALQAGKHVFCQKPLCHDIFEARALQKAARESKVSTQMGIQGHSADGARLIYEWINAGALGEVREVAAWCRLSFYPWGHLPWSPAQGTRPTATPPVPGRLHWDLWLGPAPERAYHPVYHPRTWRAWWAFGNGMLGDRGAHTLDPVVWALKLGLPTSIAATSCGLSPEVHPHSSVITFQFPARANLPPVKVTWYEGACAPRPPELEADRMMGDDEGGALIKGSRGTLMCGVYGNSPRLIPETAMRSYKRPPKTLPRIKSHIQNWVEACKAGVPASAPFDYAAPLTEICLLGNLAQRMDARIEWDAANMRVTNLPDANQYVRTEYRKGWSLGG